MDVLARPRAVVPSVPWRAIGLVAILLVLLAAVVAFVGSRRVPEPFGPASNGVIAGARDGDIYLLDSVEGTQQLIVGGDATDVYPIFARDGMRFAFLRLAPDEAADGGTLFVAAPDGSGLRALLGPEHVQAVAWSPSSDKLAVIKGNADRSLWIFPADGSTPTGPLDLGGVMPSHEVVWRPPDGKDLVFDGIEDGQFGFFVTPADGSAPPRRIVSGTDGELNGIQVSPDGRLLAYTQVGAQVVEAHLLDIGTGRSQPFASRLPELPNPGIGPPHSGGPIFSPDGSQIVFGRYWDERDARINHQLWVTSSAGDGTNARAVGPLHRSRSGHDPFWYTFAPDGKDVLILGNESEEAWLAPVDRSDPRPLEVDWGLLGDPPDWQRLAP